MKKISRQEFKRGGVSMFIVVITCTLVSIVVASFVRTMLRDHGQASKQDLSQSAYDSAQAGIEDAKRFMTRFNSECAGGFDLSNPTCEKMNAALNKDDCNMLGSAGIGSVSGETKIQTTSGDEGLNQAYTCVKVQKDTAEFLGKVGEGSSHVIPLRGKGDFNSVVISWHSKEDMTDSGDINLEGFKADQILPNRNDWTSKRNRPALMKAQFYGYNKKNQPTLPSLDKNFSQDGNGLDERIFYPISSLSSSLDSTDSLATNRRGGDGEGKTEKVSQVNCLPNLNTNTFACKVTVNLGHTVKNGDVAILRLTPIYKRAEFMVELKNNGDSVNFDGVQPKIDSTGRANDTIRRVESRIEFIDPNFPIPEFSVQSEDDSQPLCKVFWVTNKTNGDWEECTK